MRLSIRTKIVLLIASALFLSLLSYLYVGGSLLVEDKISYIYDFCLSEVNEATFPITNQIDKAVFVAQQSLSQINLNNYPNPSSTQLAVENNTLKKIFQDESQSLGIKGLLILKPENQDQFTVIEEMGATSREVIQNQKWKPSSFTKQNLIIGSYFNHYLPVAGIGKDSQGNPLVFIILMMINHSIQNTEGKKYKDLHFHLLNDNGETLASSSLLHTEIDMNDRIKMESTLIKGNFTNGVKDVVLGDKKFIVGYHRLKFGQLMMLGYIPKSVAFTSSSTMQKRFILLGISILILATGLTLIFVKQLTFRIRQLWHLTQKVSEGDFSVRVPILKGKQDEIGGLAISFNSMAEKVHELLSQVTEKARMEKELETAHTVQAFFFPSKAYESPQVEISGTHFSASECGGDWWNHCQIGPYTVVAIGDVTGHGVSSALVTAAAHTAFTLFSRELSKTPDITPSLADLINRINAAVYGSAKGETTMTFIAGLIDTRNGKLILNNAGHNTPYLFRIPTPQSPTPEDAPRQEPYKSLIPGISPFAGAENDIVPAEKIYQLEPGDVIFWYTDGLLDIRLSDQKAIKKRTLINWITELQTQQGPKADIICQEVKKKTLEFFGENSSNRSDDVTLVVTTIPLTAQFEKSAAS